VKPLLTILNRVDGVKTRAERAERTRAALLTAAADEFANHGFANTSLIQIAGAAGVTKGAVYHHFSDKVSLFKEVLSRINEAAEQQVLNALATQPTDLRKAALAALQTTFDVCMDPVAARLIYIEGPVGLGWSRWRAWEGRYTRRNVDRLLEGLVDAGYLPSDTPRVAMAALLTGMVTHAGIELAEAPARNRRQTRNELQVAMHQVLHNLGRSPKP
jgi:AcrR family transcriptional regulator